MPTISLVASIAEDGDGSNPRRLPGRKRFFVNTEFVVHPKLQHYGLTTSNLDAMVDVPEPEGKQFPHLHDTAEFRARIERGTRIMRVLGYAAVCVAALVLCVVVGAAIRLRF
jgi:hypothetical protein